MVHDGPGCATRGAYWKVCVFVLDSKCDFVCLISEVCWLRNCCYDENELESKYR